MAPVKHAYYELKVCTLQLWCPVVVRKHVFGSKTARVTVRLCPSFFSIFESATTLVHLIWPSHLPFICACARLLGSFRWTNSNMHYLFATCTFKDKLFSFIYNGPTPSNLKLVVKLPLTLSTHIQWLDPCLSVNILYYQWSITNSTRAQCWVGIIQGRRASVTLVIYSFCSKLQQLVALNKLQTLTI